MLTPSSATWRVAAAPSAGSPNGDAVRIDHVEDVEGGGGHRRAMERRLRCRTMPIHLRAGSSDYASAVLVPGDPLRAAYIAETFFDPGFRMVNEVRGALGYTGTI